MEVVFPYCAGLDVHKKRVTACRLVSDSTGQVPEGVAELQTFGTMTHELLALADWLVEAGVTHVAMESTGEDWKPGYNLLEGIVAIFLVNASHVKNVPGRKTDPADARWLAKLMRYGLLQASFIPPKGQPSQGPYSSIFAWLKFSLLRHGYRFCRSFVACVPS